MCPPLGERSRRADETQNTGYCLSILCVYVGVACCVVSPSGGKREREREEREKGVRVCPPTGERRERERERERKRG